MTVLYGVARPGFVALLAERRFHGRNTATGAVTSGEHEKLAVHGVLPIAIATSGLAFLQGGHTRDHVQRVLAAYDGSSALADVVRHLADTLGPIVQIERRKALALGEPSEKVRVRLYVAVHDGQRGCLGRLTIAEGVELHTQDRQVSGPSSLTVVLGQAADDRWVFGDDCEDGTAVIARGRELIARVIAMEAKRALPEAGGMIDAVLVQSHSVLRA